MLTISRRDLQAIYRQAVEEYPGECCGLLTQGEDGEPARVHRCANIQNQLHAKDPKQFALDSRRAYYVEPRSQIQIITAAEEAGGWVSGFYHSHVDCDACFSAEDRERAVVWGQPAYAGAAYLVVSVFADGVRGHRVFAWDENGSDFAETDIAVVE